MGESDLGKDIAALIHVLENDPSWQPREAAAESLGRLGRAAKAAVPSLRKAAVNDASWQVRAKAAWALGFILAEG